MSDLSRVMKIHESRDAWLSWRAGPKFGASEVADLFGCGYASALARVLDKAGIEKLPAFTAEQDEKHEIALALEESLAGLLYTRRTGREAAMNDALRPRTWHRTIAPFLFATPDAWTSDRVVQVKTAAETPWDTPPVGYVVQVQVEMFCTQHERADIAAFFYGGGTMAYRVYEVEADPEFQQLVVERAEWASKLVERAMAGEPYELPEPGVNDAALLARLTKQRARTVVHQFTDKDMPALQRWLDVNDDRKVYAGLASKLEDAEKHERHKLVALMDGAEIGVLPDGRKVKLTVRERDGYAVPASSWVELAVVKEKKG